MLNFFEALAAFRALCRWLPASLLPGRKPKRAHPASSPYRDDLTPGPPGLVFRAAGQALRGQLRENKGGLSMANVMTLAGGSVAAAAKVKARRGGARKLAKHLQYMVPEVRLALIREPESKALPVQCPEDVEKFVEPLKFYDSEHFVAFHLNARHEVTGYFIVSKGTVSASLVHPREVFKAAILANSFAILVAHNHPGGSLSPSAEDLETTEQLVKAGRLLGVPVVDHVIVAAGGIHSIRENRPDLWR